MTRKSELGTVLTAAAFAITTAAATGASAFCGFYVGGADAKLFNDATQVVLMREGTRTVLSMENHYKGPPAKFAMVVPVPVVLQKENVKTLTKDLFTRVEQLTAPRLVEYWEQDPCMRPQVYPMMAPRKLGAGAAAPAPMTKEADDLGVKVEAQFTVAEYEIVILSAQDAAGLDTWLRREQYTIPDGAEPYLRPYVQAGSKFFVAKVDPTKVTFENGAAKLSPLRFHYDAETFSLPVRLGLMNSSGTQDLIVTIIAKNQRYEVANYPNVTIPTNFDVAESARGKFGQFYTALFDKALASKPKAVVTEYAWMATSCDPCPTPPLSESELRTLGADVLGPGSEPGDERPSRRFYGGSNFVVTRMHARYSKDSLGEDLVFRAGQPIAGGREVRDGAGQLEHDAKVQSGGINNFQGRYAIRHPWTGPITCKNPQRGIWGGPPNGRTPKSQPAVDLAFAPRGNVQLASFVKGPVPQAFALPGAPVLLGSPVVPVPPSKDPPPSVAPPSPSASASTVVAQAGGPSDPRGAKPTGPGEPDAGAVGPALPPTAPRTAGGCGCDVAPASSGSVAAGGALALLGMAVTRLRARRRAGPP
jgi:hypothetical protein